MPIEIDTSRFELYAPFVTDLEISRLPGVPFRIEGRWRPFLMRSHARVLLPNLRRLSFETFGKFHEDQLGWIAMFLAPSLLEIQICAREQPIWINLSSASEMLRQISEKCPKLQTLTIFPGEPLYDQPIPGTVMHEGDSTRWLDDILFSSPTASISTQIRQFGNLCSLTASPAMFHPDLFLAISELPCLNSLVVRSAAAGGPIYQYSGLSESSFSALKELELDEIDPRIIAHLCSLAPLVRNLEEVRIRFPDGDDARTWSFEGGRARSTIGVLSRLSPRLQHICLDVGQEQYTEEIQLSPMLVDALRCLPLRYLDLGSIDADVGPLLNEFCAALPLLEVLYLSFETFSLRMLLPLAIHLPRLCYLELGDIDVTYIPPMLETDFSGYYDRPNFPICIKCDWWEIPFSFKSVAR